MSDYRMVQSLLRWMKGKVLLLPACNAVGVYTGPSSETSDERLEPSRLNFIVDNFMCWFLIDIQDFSR